MSSSLEQKDSSLTLGKKLLLELQGYEPYDDNTENARRGGRLFCYSNAVTYVEAGALLNVTDTLRNMNALMWCVEMEHVEFLSYLLKRMQKYQIDAFGPQGNTALHLAAASASPCFTTKIIAAGGSVDVHNTLGETPLMHTLMHNRFENFEALLMAGAKAGLCDHKGFSTTDYARGHRDARFKNLIIKKAEEDLHTAVLHCTVSQKPFKALQKIKIKQGPQKA